MNIIDLRKKVDDSDGKRIFDIIQHLAVTHWSVNKNFEELMKLFASFESNDEFIYQQNQEQLNDLLKEFLRLFQNYLGSTKALISHVRVAICNLGSDEFADRFEKEKNTIKEDEYNIFLQKFRNYCIHYKLPIISANVTIDQNNNEEKKILIEKDFLLEWDQWGSTSKEFLKKQKKQIDIKDILEKHHCKFNKFHQNFYEMAVNFFSKELIEFKKLEEELFIAFTLIAPMHRR